MFSFGLWPRFVLVFSCFLFRFFRWRNASLAGGFAGCRFGVFVGSLFCFNRFADFKDRASLYRCFCCLLTCKDRAISATSAKLEGKKNWHFRTFLSEQMGFNFCPEQPCLARVPQGAVLMHVDDLLFCGDYEYFHGTFLRKCQEKFQ